MIKHYYQKHYYGCRKVYRPRNNRPIEMPRLIRKRPYTVKEYRLMFALGMYN